MLLRINEEPQTSQKSFSEATEKSYSLVARAVYYAALTMATELQSKEEYHLLRKVYSVWICYERPIPYSDEPIIRYSIQPDEDYYYRDNTPLRECKSRFDDGDLLGIILISVPEIENLYFGKKTDSRYSRETVVMLHNLLAENVAMEDRLAFYYDANIIKKGCEDVSQISMVESYEQQIEERDQLVESYKLTISHMAIALGKARGWIATDVVSYIAENAGIDFDEARDLYETGLRNPRQ